MGHKVDVTKLDHMSHTTTRTCAAFRCVGVHSGADDYVDHINLSNYNTNLNHI